MSPRRILTALVSLAALMVVGGCQFRPLGFLADPSATPSPSATFAPVSLPVETMTPFPTPFPEGCQPLSEMLKAEWVPVQDSAIGFQFQVPARWRTDTSLASDLILLSSDRQRSGQEIPDCGRVDMEFRADGIGSWVGWNPEPDAGEIVVGEQKLSAYRIDRDGSGQGGEPARRTEVYMVGGGYFYFLTFEYTPPPDISEVEFQTQLRAVDELIDRILSSLVVRL